MKDQSGNCYLIIIKPFFEAWIVNAAKDSGISLGKYDFPENPFKLHKIINANLEKFGALLDEMIHRNSKYLCALNEILRAIFKEVKDNKLINIFRDKINKNKRK